MAAGVKGRPEQGRPERREVHAPARGRLAFEKCLVKLRAAGNARVVEILVLVLEISVVIERERAQPGEVLDFVGRVQPRRDRRQRDEKGQ